MNKTYLEVFANIMHEYERENARKEEGRETGGDGEPIRYPRVAASAALRDIESLDRARRLIGKDTLEETMAALEQCFEPGFWPLRRFRILMSSLPG